MILWAQYMTQPWRTRHDRHIVHSPRFIKSMDDAVKRLSSKHFLCYDFHPSFDFIWCRMHTSKSNCQTFMFSKPGNTTPPGLHIVPEKHRSQAARLRPECEGYELHTWRIIPSPRICVVVSNYCTELAPLLLSLLRIVSCWYSLIRP